MSTSAAPPSRALPPRRLALGLAAGGAALALGTLLLVRKDWLGLGIFMPHGACYMWRADLIGGHIAADLLIGLSYV